MVPNQSLPPWKTVKAGLSPGKLFKTARLKSEKSIVVNLLTKPRENEVGTTKMEWQAVSLMEEGSFLDKTIMGKNCQTEQRRS